MDTDDRFKHLATDPRFKKLRKKRFEPDERFQLKKQKVRDKRGWDKRRPEKSPEAESSEDDVEEKDKDEDGKDEEDSDQEDIDGESSIVGTDSSVSSSSDESSDEDDQDELVERIKYDWQPLDHDAVKADATYRRLAIQNLDWDHIDVRDLYTLVNSIRPPLNVRIYISEFGKQRLAKEEQHGPEELSDLANVDEEEEDIKKLEEKMKQFEEKDKLAMKQFKNNEYEDADEVLDKKDIELRERIRRYQLSKMKYFYAIAEFDSVESAEEVYKELDGLEYEGSSLEVDLRFVPDDVEFGQEDMRAECDKQPDLATYKVPQFINTALQQTSVNLTWDETDVRRQEKLRRAYTKQELEMDDLDAYLASGTDSEDDDDGDDEEANLESDGKDPNSDRVSVVTGNSEARANKYRMLLKTLENEEASKKKVDVDVVWGDYDEDEVAMAKGYKAKKSAEETDEDEDDEAEAEAEDIGLCSDEEVDRVLQDDSCSEIEESDHGEDEEEEELEARVAEEKRKKREKKRSKKKGPKKGSERDGDEDEDLDLLLLDVDSRPKNNFEFNPDDDRFQAVYESGLYNIDPSHPKFKRTEAFNKMAEKKRSKRQKR